MLYDYHITKQFLIFQGTAYIYQDTAAQEAGAPHREYINRKKENAFFTPM